MRILFDYRPALRQRTGVGQYMHELASALSAQLSPPDALVLFSSSLRDRLPRAAVRGTGQLDLRIPVRVLNLAWHRLQWPPVEWLAGRVDIAHAAHPLMIPARRAARVVTIYDLDFLDHPEHTRAEIRRDYPLLAGSHARRADLVVVISEYTAQAVRTRLQVPAERIVICRPGAPAARPRAPQPTPGPILFVGTIEPRKNLAMLFAAYERVAARRPDAPRLVLAGRSVEQSAAILDSLSAMPTLSGRVEYRGYVSDDERQRLYDEASMLVLPSLDEGFGMTVVEAMQAGVPVIAANRGALPEVAGTAGILVDPTDASDIAAAIERLLASPEERHARTDAGYAQARQFSWGGSASRLLDAYREMLTRQRRPR